MVKDGNQLIKMEEEKYATIRIDINFKKRIKNFIDLFEKEKGVRLSFSQATKIIDTKIENIGGLKV